MPESKLGIKKGEPIKLPDGTIIDTNDEGGTNITTKEEQDAAAEVDAVADDPFDDPDAQLYQRTLADINVTPQHFNPVMLVLSYSMWGLDIHAIARYLNLDVEHVEQIQATDLYVNTRKELLEAIQYAEAGAIHGYLTRQARDAAKTVAHTMKNGKPDAKLKAAQDILDRSGFRAADRTEHVHRFEDELRIVHMQEKEHTTIDIDFEGNDA